MEIIKCIDIDKKEIEISVVEKDLRNAMEK